MRNGRTLDAAELGGLQILNGVAVESVLGLLEHCPSRLLEEGETLLEIGDDNRTMFMILEGELGIFLDGETQESVAVLSRGQTVGEMSVIDGSSVSARVVAAAPSRLLVVDKANFWRLVRASHEFATNLLLLMAERMRTSNSAFVENVKLKDRYEQDALVDALTGLNNRRWLDVNLSRLVARHKMGGEPLTLLMFDIDHFKRFNDDYGHSAGDEVLARVGDCIRSRLRPTDLASRYGGEEFVAILAGTPLEGGCVAAERLRRAISDTQVSTSDQKLLPQVTISIGVVEAGLSEDANALVERADKALYRAKDGGRNRVERG
jgi:diguanylate cyclase (GGDEF)-like protein